MNALDTALLLVSLHRAAFHCADTSQYRNFSRQSPITPPPDPEADIARARGLEEQARNALLEAGCPPSYPTDLKFPLQNVPEKYKVISYWQSIPGTGRVVLTAQLSDWREFCDHQKRIRQYYLQRNTFSVFLNKVWDRRRRHGFEGDICLHLDPEQQSRLENWIEFQNYHLEIHEGLQREITDDREELDAAQKKLETGASGPEGAEEVEILEGRVKYGKRKLKQHDNLVQWIKQQRKAMAAEQAISIHATGGHDRPRTIPPPPSPGRRKRDQNPRSPLSPARSAVSKKPSRKRGSLRLQKSNVAQVAENATADLSAPRRSKRIPNLGDKSSRCQGKHAAALFPSTEGDQDYQERTRTQGQAIRQRQPETAANGPVQTSKGNAKIYVWSCEDTQWTGDHE